MSIPAFYSVLRSLDYDLEDLILNLLFLNLRILHVCPDERPSQLAQIDVIVRLFSLDKNFMPKIASPLFIINFSNFMVNNSR
jgi:hypothetical protein